MAGEPYIGEIRLFGGSFTPRGWIVCDGRTLPISGRYAQLYDAIGTRYGGSDGSFAVPDLRPQAGDLTYMIAAIGVAATPP